MREVYFIGAYTEAKELISIKIGISRSLSSRFLSLQTSNPFRLELLASFSASMAVEKALHFKFDHVRIRGEWFHPAEELLEFIEKCKAEPFTLRDLVKRGRPKIRPTEPVAQQLAADWKAVRTPTTGRGNVIPLEGKVFGRLIVCKHIGTRSRSALWSCMCSCGKMVNVTRRNLKRGKVKSCGCLAAEYKATPDKAGLKQNQPEPEEHQMIDDLGEDEDYGDE